MRVSPLLAWLLLSELGLGQPLTTAPQLSKITQEIRTAVDPDEAMAFVRGIHANDRWFTFPKFQETAAYLRQTMTAIGLRDVEVVATPADGETQFGFWTMPMAWDVKRATLEIVEPALPAGTKMLADYGQAPASIVMWSGPTPPGGVIADVVLLEPKQLGQIDVKGKMVLIQAPLDLGRRGALKAALFKAGAEGIISDVTESPELPDGHYWINAWGDRGWGFTRTSSPLTGFSITPRQGAYLRGLLAGGQRVRVKAVVESRYYSGSYPYVTGILQGSGSDEEVLELGHAYETGAQDNATGVAAMLESLAALNRLIETGKLKRPRRSIRILAMAEDYGSMAYVVSHAEHVRRTIGAICMDTPAGQYDMAGTSYTFLMNPDVARSYQDALIMRVAENYYAGLPRRFPRWAPYRPTTDSYLSDPMIGIPTVAVSGGSGVNSHHNSADTLDRVDPRSLRDLSAMTAAYLYYLASASEDDIPWLAGITVNRGYENIVRAAAVGPAKIAYTVERDEAAVLSTLRLAPPERRAAIEESLNPLLKSLRDFAADQASRFRQAAVPARETDPRRSEAASMIVRRKRPGPVTLDDLPFERREGYPGFGGDPPPLILLTWCDGKRDLAEVIRLIELERGPMNFDFVGYFKFLARHGYVDILTAKK